MHQRSYRRRSVQLPSKFSFEVKDLTFNFTFPFFGGWDEGEGLLNEGHTFTEYYIFNINDSLDCKKKKRTLDTSEHPLKF